MTRHVRRLSLLNDKRRHACMPPNVGLLRTKDRCPISEFVSVRGPARLVVEENRIAGPRSSFAESSARSFAAEADPRWADEESLSLHAPAAAHRRTSP